MPIGRLRLSWGSHSPIDSTTFNQSDAETVNTGPLQDNHNTTVLTIHKFAKFDSQGKIVKHSSFLTFLFSSTHME